MFEKSDASFPKRKGGGIMTKREKSYFTIILLLFTIISDVQPKKGKHLNATSDISFFYYMKNSFTKYILTKNTKKINNYLKKYKN